MLRCSVTSNTPEDDASAKTSVSLICARPLNSQQRTSTKTIRTVHTTSKLTAGEQTRNGLVVGVVYCGVGTDLKTAHGVVEYGSLDQLELVEQHTINATWYTSFILNSPPWKNYYVSKIGNLGCTPSCRMGRFQGSWRTCCDRRLNVRGVRLSKK